jgi:hypothetical protein
MARVIMALVLLLGALPPLARAADDGRVSYLEQEVRELKRQVMALTRRLDDATTRPSRWVPPDRSAASSEATGASREWVDADKWRRLRPGMNELEVISLLGPPTSMREDGADHVLFYALEIGASGFLGGSVKFRDGAVTEIQLPALH